MNNSIIGPFRSMTLLLTVSSFLAINAQDVDRYFRVERHLLEAMVKSKVMDFKYPVLIVATEESMAMPSEMSKSQRFEGVPVRLCDNYVELEAGNRSLQFRLAPEENPYEFKISDCNNSPKYLVSSRGKLSIGAPGSVFTLNFNESDENCFLLQPNYKKNMTDYSIDYNESTGDFSLVSEDMKGASLYMFDNMGFATAEASLSEDLSSISISLDSDKTFKGTEVFIKYILNNGEDVTVSDLIASEHCHKVSWPINRLDPIVIPLPNYNQAATTLWAIPVIKYLDPDNPDAPVGPVFMHSDISTGIHATNIAAEDCAPIYHTIQGVRVSAPSAPGIYLCRRGSDVTKILIR